MRLCVLSAVLFSSALTTLGQTAPANNDKAVLWSEPNGIASRDLRYGIGGEKDAPKGSFTFTDEDLEQNSPKFNVKDDDGRKWKVKLAQEARSETAATRLVWAVGYFTDEDYFVHDLRVKNLPHLHRGSQFEHGDHVTDARLELKSNGEKKESHWHWRKNPFVNTRELNGLRVLMCVLNNWDLKDENNTIYRDKSTGQNIYVVSDLGATFGKPGHGWTNAAKDNPKEYAKARFITKKTDRYVDFEMTAPPWLYIFNLAKPTHYWQALSERSLAKHIPRADAKWMGDLLAQLTDQQLQDAFTAAGYNDSERTLLIDTLKKRIHDLQQL